MKRQCCDEHFFCEGIWSEILSWLEVKYLLRCKSVCKLWYAVIDNKQFVGMHATHYGRGSYHYIEKKSLDTETINSDGVKETIRYVDSAGEEGFLLVKRASLSKRIYRLSNPSTKRILDLPDPHKGVLIMSIFQNSSTGSYYVCSAYKIHKFELVDLGGQSNDPCPNANLSWKPVYISEVDRLRSQQKYGFSAVLCKGILYYLVLLKVGLSKPKIICFDLVKQQTCTILDMPDQTLRFNRREVNFQRWGGKPAVSFVKQEKLNLWVLEDYKKQKWADTIQIPLPSLEEYPSWNKVIPPYIYDNDGEDVFVYRGPLKRYWMYCPKSKKLSKFSSPPKRVRATLVSIKGMQPEKKDC